MPVTADPRLQSAMDALTLPGVVIGHRLIAPGDEDALRAEEVRGISESVVERRRASGAARIVARELLQRLGHADCQLPRAASGAPVWPAGVIGSLAHDRRVAVAAVADRRRIDALGIDIEPAESLPMDLLDIIATPDERPRLGENPIYWRLLFAAKEAVYKAVYPLDRKFLEHHDVQIDFSRRKGTVRNGRTAELRFCISTHLIVLAFVPHRDGEHA